jgi:hypothetical protein
VRKVSVLFMLLFAFATALAAQIPSTPAGRQFSAWQKAQDSGDPATIQDFIGKNMPFGRVEQELAVHNQSGGYDVKRVLETNDTHIVVLAQERAGAQQFFRITFNVNAAEPYTIAAIGIQAVPPPADLAWNADVAASQRARQIDRTRQVGSRCTSEDFIRPSRDDPKFPRNGSPNEKHW